MHLNKLFAAVNLLIEHSPGMQKIEFDPWSSQPLSSSRHFLCQTFGRWMSMVSGDDQVKVWPVLQLLWHTKEPSVSMVNSRIGQLTLIRQTNSYPLWLFACENELMHLLQSIICVFVSGMPVFLMIQSN